MNRRSFLSGCMLVSTAAVGLRYLLRDDKSPITVQMFVRKEFKTDHECLSFLREKLGTQFEPSYVQMIQEMEESGQILKRFRGRSANGSGHWGITFADSAAYSRWSSGAKGLLQRVPGLDEVWIEVTQSNRLLDIIG